MAGSNISGPGGYGLILDEKTGWGFNRTGGTVAVGEVLQCDHTDAGSDFAHTDQSFAEGDFTGNFRVPVTGTAAIPGIGNEVNATTVGQPPAIFCVVIDTGPSQGADNGLIRVAYKHPNVMVKPASGASLTEGIHMFPANGVKTATNTLAKQVKSIGFARKTSSAADALTACIFDGIHGFGTAPLDALI